MDLAEELQGLATANALVQAVLLAGLERMGLISLDQVKDLLEGAIGELEDGEAGNTGAAVFQMETIVELIEESRKDGGTPGRAALRLIRGGRDEPEPSGE